jgi:hypothetical protein
MADEKAKPTLEELAEQHELLSQQFTDLMLRAEALRVALVSISPEFQEVFERSLADLQKLWAASLVERLETQKSNEEIERRRALLLAYRGTKQ